MINILKISAKWCSPCTQMTTQISRLVENNKNISIKNLDVDIDTEVLKKYGIRSIPVLIKLDKDNMEVARLTGAQKDSILLEFLNGDI